MKRKLNIRNLLILVLPCLCLCFGLVFLFLPKEDKPVSKPSEAKEKVKTDTKSLKTFLEILQEPVGQTMYIWGGGWNEEDTGAGQEALTLGISEKWKEFFLQQDSSYNMENHLYEIHNGLDCSGYVGWAIYNLMETKSNQGSGYVMLASEMASTFSENGWGNYTHRLEVTDYKPGDIMSNEEHVYVVLGTMDDGSVLLIHSSPPGVRICGTPDSAGSSLSMANELADSIMSEYYPDWYAKYPSVNVDSTYLTNYDQFRWNEDTLKDAQKIQKMSGNEIIELLYE